MTRDAAIDEELLGDVLIDVVDDIRRDVHGALGTRPWSVAVVIRRWSGGNRGDGNPTIHVLELDPTPMVKRVTRDRVGPAGREAEGSITMTGVSLRYTEEELQPRVESGMEVGYRLMELNGQAQRTRWFVLAASPVPRRGDKSGDGTDWYLLLNETSDQGNLDQVEP